MASEDGEYTIDPSEAAIYAFGLIFQHLRELASDIDVREWAIERVNPVVHVHGQFKQGSIAIIAGNRPGIMALHELLGKALNSGDTVDSMFDAAGEEFPLQVVIDNGINDELWVDPCRHPLEEDDISRMWLFEPYTRVAASAYTNKLVNDSGSP